jgi:hypothetical protein
MQRSRIAFALEGPAIGATPRFENAYRRIRRLLDAGDYAAAEPLLGEIESGGRHMYEDALFWALKYGYLEGVQSTNTAEKLRAATLALGHQDDRYWPPDIFVAVAQRLYVLQVQAIDFSAARATFERPRDSEQARRSSHHARVVAGEHQALRHLSRRCCLADTPELGRVRRLHQG